MRIPDCYSNCAVNHCPFFRIKLMVVTSEFSRSMEKPVVRKILVVVPGEPSRTKGGMHEVGNNMLKIESPQGMRTMSSR